MEKSKKIISCLILLFTVISFSSCHRRAKITKNEAAIEWEDSVWNFKEISAKEGDVKHEFKFDNIGPVPVVINDVVTNCKCTSATYSKEPVQPGESGTVTITLHAGTTNIGMLDKNIFVYVNTFQGLEHLHVSGFIAP